ncbi:recombinase RecU [Pontibacillus halophilus JSM 076056 = DSM 19796]|uniref:Holliday junction resolvase RecU n=1 Tax=Pontibacillus halophilus JSM 076056 = DSM 19796 TaxID=1385510 RepID=A0A0A5GLU8_9BACI|nr:Holliday junction resolvase RecU [Pontibacillus halophilus]KGX92130.1 recombinase RecU [Pontibacillus halophilus JSM 076056 = DSM 19796]
MNYPNGKKRAAYQSKQTRSLQPEFSNRGMSLEEDINQTNEAYLAAGKAVIHKKPTPVQIVKVDYPKRSAAVIKEAYFRQASTTDYNGVYKGTYVDFEAKETKNKTSFPLSNIHEHQIEHMKQVMQQNGLCFMIVRFSTLGETFFLHAEKLFSIWDRQTKGGRKSIPYEVFKEEGILIPFRYHARVDYLSVLDDYHL